MHLHFEAMRTFSQVDNQVISNPQLKSVIDSRYSLKQILLTNPKVGACALKALEQEASKLDSNVLEYVQRKITSFSSKANPNQERCLIEREISLVESAVADFVAAYKALCQDSALVKLNDEHTKARKEFKLETAKNIRAVADELGLPPKDEKAFHAALEKILPVIQSLAADAKTKAYLEYKTSYVHAFEKL